MRTKILSLDLARPLYPLTIDAGDEGLKILVRAKEQVLGWVRIAAPGDAARVVSVEELQGAILRQASWKVVERHLRSQLDPFWNTSGVHLNPVSIIVCTTNKNAVRLQSLLRSIRALPDRGYEVIVVAFGAAADRKIPIAGERNIQHVHAGGGLNSARNLGIERATHGVIAFVSEHATLDTGWLKALDRALTPGVMAVTGYVAPLECDWEDGSSADNHFKWVRNKFTRQVFRGSDGSDKQLSQAGNFGSGVNMAFRREIFVENGMFDPGFDTSPSAEDPGADDMFQRVLRSNGLLVYEPSMLAWLAH